MEGEKKRGTINKIKDVAAEALKDDCRGCGRGRDDASGTGRASLW